MTARVFAIRTVAVLGPDRDDPSEDGTTPRLSVSAQKKGNRMKYLSVCAF